MVISLVNSKIILLVLFIFFSTSGKLFSDFYTDQDTEESRIQKLAYKFFKEENYEKSLPFFQELIRLYAKDHEYNYHTGVCFLKTGDPEKAIHYLRYAATGEVPSQVYYYLGRAYHLNYEFYKGVSFYKRYKLYGKQDGEEKILVDRLINMCYNGAYLMQYAAIPKVISKREVSENLLSGEYEDLEMDGQIRDLPGKYKTEHDRKPGERLLYFSSHDIMPGGYMYYASYGKDGRSKDIYRVQKTGPQQWGAPQRLDEIINTPYNEDFPVYQPESNILYFASDGHYSMGGYDIYKSVYNEENNSWSPPENMDFPVNSPYDDYLFVTDAFERKAMFASNRNSGKRQVSLFEIDLSEGFNRLKVDETMNIKEVARLNPVNRKDGGKAISAEMAMKESGVFFRKLNETYNELLNEALSLQTRADSLGTLLRELEASVVSLPESEKTKTFQQIKHLEEIISEIQKRADEKYRQLRELEVNYLAKDMDQFIQQKRIEKVLLSEFSNVPEVRDIIGPKGMREFTELKQKIENARQDLQSDNYEDEIQKWRKRERQSTWKLKKAWAKRKLQSLQEKQLVEHVKIRKDIFNLYKESYLLINQYVPLAIDRGEDEVFTEKGKDIMKKAGNTYQKSLALYYGMDKKEDSAQLEQLMAIDSLKDEFIPQQKEAFLTFLAYDVYENEEMMNAAIAREEKLFQQQMTDSLDQKEAPGLLVDQRELEASLELENLPGIKKAVDSVKSTRREDSLYNETHQMVKDRNQKEKEFAILSESPYSEENPIPVNQKLPDGVIYRIQLGAFSKELPQHTFGGFFPVTAEYFQDTDVYKYYVGLFRTRKSAGSALSIIQKKGYRDAYILAYLNGRLISTNRAQALERDAESFHYTMDKTGTDSLVYKIQIGAFRGGMPEDILNAFRRLAPESEIETHQGQNDVKIYTLGRFTAYNKANVLREFLVSKGHEGIFIVAFRGGEKVPVHSDSN
mgnify:CR=1 FL=1